MVLDGSWDLITAPAVLSGGSLQRSHDYRRMDILKLLD